MNSPLRVALCVEGSDDTGLRQHGSWLDLIWNEHLPDLVGGRRFERVIPISKKDIVAMALPAHRPTGTEPLDMKLARLGAGTHFDAAIVAWDLHPKWNVDGPFCRWDETVKLLQCLSRSESLPDNWRSACAERHGAYAARRRPSDRPNAPALAPGSVLPLCMDPEFESVLTADERAVMRALGVATRPARWPSGWGAGGTRRPGDDVLRQAIDSLPRQSEVRRKVRGSWRQNKGAWGELLLRNMLDDAAGREGLAAHPVVTRFAELTSA